jgi:uncharacterized protein YoxC
MKTPINNQNFSLKDVIQYCIIVGGFVSTFTFFQAKVNSNEKEIEKINKLLDEVELKVLRSEIKTIKEDVSEIKGQTDEILTSINDLFRDIYKRDSK